MTFRANLTEFYIRESLPIYSKKIITWHSYYIYFNSNLICLKHTCTKHQEDADSCNTINFNFQTWHSRSFKSKSFWILPKNNCTPRGFIISLIYILKAIQNCSYSSKVYWFMKSYEILPRHLMLKKSDA